MIDVIGKYTRNGDIVAWQVSEDGLTYNIAYRALYHKLLFDSLIESGFKFSDYYGDITTPNGTHINDVPECEEYLPESELVSLIDSIEVGMVDEVEVLKYMDKSVKLNFIDMPKKDSYDINTREELLDYLDVLNKSNESGIHKFNLTNINEIVNPDALFTLEEVAPLGSDLKVIYGQMFDNFTIHNIDDLNALKGKYGINKDDTPIEAQMKLLKSFYEYGVPGIKANVLNIRYEEYPTAPFSNLEKNLSSSASLKYGVLDDSTNKFYSVDVCGKDFYDMSGADDYDTDAYIGAYSLSSNRKETISSHCRLIPYGDKTAPSRIIFELVSDEGIRALYVSDCNEAHLYRGPDQLMKTLSLYSFKTLENRIIKLSDILKHGDKYIEEVSLVGAFVKGQMVKMVKKPKFKTSFDIMVGVGVSPYVAPMLMSRLISEGASTSIDISKPKDFGSLHFRCSQVIREGFSESILRKYCDYDKEILDKDFTEQLYELNEATEELKEAGRYLVEPVLPAGTLPTGSKEYMEWSKEYYGNEIGNANFVMSVLNGDYNIRKFAIGQKADCNFIDAKMNSAVLSVLKMEQAVNPSISYADFFNDAIYKYIDPDMLFKQRDAMYKGCLEDMAAYRSQMASEAESLIYVTKVFRENANTKLEDSRRHYCFECLKFSKASGTMGRSIFNSLVQQMTEQMFDVTLVDKAYIISDTIALTIMRLRFDTDYEYTYDDGIYTFTTVVTMPNEKLLTVKFKLSKEYFLAVTKGPLFVRAYCSNYDYCNEQFNLANMTAKVYCVNASITPWNTIPREGFSISEHNLYLNYYSTPELLELFATNPTYKERVTDHSLNIKVVESLKSSMITQKLFPTMPDVLFSPKERAAKAKEGFFLSSSEDETIIDYMNRTANDIMTEFKEGHCIKNTMLKSDIVFSMFKPYVAPDDVSSKPTYYDELDPKKKMLHISNFMPRVISSNWLSELDTVGGTGIAMSGFSTVSRIKYEDIPFEQKLWNHNLNKSNFGMADVYISRGNLCDSKGFRVNTQQITTDHMDILCASKKAIQVSNNEYIVNSLNGLLKVRV